MRASDFLVSLALGVLAVAPSASARCRLQVKLASGSAFTRSARCTDGDPACDSDSKLDSTCDFQASLCFSTDAVTACDQADLLGMSIPSVPGLGGLPNLFEKFKTSATRGHSARTPRPSRSPPTGRRRGRSS